MKIRSRISGVFLSSDDIIIQKTEDEYKLCIILHTWYVCIRKNIVYTIPRSIKPFLHSSNPRSNIILAC